MFKKCFLEQTPSNSSPQHPAVCAGLHSSYWRGSKYSELCQDLADVIISVRKGWRDCAWMLFKLQICHLIIRKEVAPYLIAWVSSSWHDSQTPFRDGITWFSSTCASRQHLYNCSQGECKGAENISSLLPHSRETQLLWKQEQLSERRVYWIGFYNLLDILQLHGEKKKLKTTEALPHLLLHLPVDSLVKNGFAHHKMTLALGVVSWSSVDVSGIVQAWVPASVILQAK